MLGHREVDVEWNSQLYSAVTKYLRPTKRKSLFWLTVLKLSVQGSLGACGEVHIMAEKTSQFMSMMQERNKLETQPIKDSPQ